MIRALLVDDHELVRTGFRRILEAAPDIDVVGEAATGEDAITQVRAAEPDVVLMDLNMPGIGGIEATRRICASHPKVRVIAVTVHCDTPFPTQLHEAGALGYLTKGCPAEEMLQAVRTVAKGKPYMSREVSQKIALAQMSGANAGSPFEQLAAREIQVLMLIIEGRTTQEISDALRLSPKTVSTYRCRLHEKLGVETDVELTHLAIRYGLIATHA